MFQQAYKFAEEFRAGIPKQQRVSASAGAWRVVAVRQDEVEKQKKLPQSEQQEKEIQKKNPNFVFAAFSEEIISRLGEMQFTDLRVGTLSNEANQFKGKEWNQDEKYPIEIRASHHPPGHDRYGLRLVFVQDKDGEYKEFAPLEPRTGQLPIGTKAIASILPGETSTADATIQVPGREPIRFNIREIKKFSYADKTWNGEQVSLEIGKKAVPTGVVRIKLEGKVLGQLDADSVKQLQAMNYLSDGKVLNLKLTTISEKHNAFAIAESPNGNYLKIDKINSHNYKDQKFNDTEYRKLTLEAPQVEEKDAVLLNGKPLGVLFYNKDKQALREIGVLNYGKLTPLHVTLQSNFNTTMMVKVDPTTIEYPEVWTKESQAFSQPTINSLQLAAIQTTAPILHKIKERPTMLRASAEDKELGMTRLAVDNHKVETVTKWLTDKDIAFAPVPREEVPMETKKGLAVFTLANSSIPEPVFDAMTKKFGSVIESQEQYQQKVRSLPDRPKHLKPPQPVVSTLSSQASPQTPQPQQQNLAAPNQESQTVTIDHLRSWYISAVNLGKPDEYKNRIVEVANEFKATGQLSPKAKAAMEQDTLSRLAQITHKIVSALGQPEDDGCTRVNGKVYDVSFHPEQRSWALAHKNGDVILSVQSQQVQINNLTPDVLRDFETANSKLNESLANKQKQSGLLER